MKYSDLIHRDDCKNADKYRCYTDDSNILSGTAINDEMIKDEKLIAGLPRWRSG